MTRQQHLHAAGDHGELCVEDLQYGGSCRAGRAERRHLCPPRPRCADVRNVQRVRLGPVVEPRGRLPGLPQRRVATEGERDKVARCLAAR